MQIETIGKYQLHLIALEASGGGWDPFVSVFRFDDDTEDFRCVLEKQHASDHFMNDYDDAIEAARLAGNAYIQANKL